MSSCYSCAFLWQGFFFFFCVIHDLDPLNNWGRLSAAVINTGHCQRRGGGSPKRRAKRIFRNGRSDLFGMSAGVDPKGMMECSSAPVSDSLAVTGMRSSWSPDGTRGTQQTNEMWLCIGESWEGECGRLKENFWDNWRRFHAFVGKSHLSEVGFQNFRVHEIPRLLHENLQENV